jgi:hypothetical protein
MIEMKICRFKLRRLGEAEHEPAEIQHRAQVPGLHEIIEVAVNRRPVRARVVHVFSPPPPFAPCTESGP